MLTGPKLFAVRAELLAGSTGTSPGPATLATWIVPAGADRVAPLPMVTGPPTRPRLAPAAPPSWLPLTVIVGGVAVRKPNAAGGVALSVLASGLVAWNRA